MGQELLAVVAASGRKRVYAPATDEQVVAASVRKPDGAVSGDIAALLQQVRVIDRLPDVDGYDRGCGKGEGCVFGPAWNDPLDHSGCDARFLGGFSVL